MNKALATLSFIVLFLIQPTSKAQNYWKSYRIKDGLISNQVNQLAVSESRVYIATDKGFSVLEDHSFTNYDKSNSSLPDSNIRLLRQWNDTVWLATDSGLSRFANGNFTHFNDTNGMLTIKVEDMEFDSKGNLWIASLQGLSVFEADTFRHERGRRVYDIGINQGDTIYANVNNPAIVNLLSPVTCEIFDGSSWTAVADTGSLKSINNSKFIQQEIGGFLIGSSDRKFYSNDSIFRLKSTDLPTSEFNTSNLTDLLTDKNGTIWSSFTNNTQFQTLGGIYLYDGLSFTLMSSNLPSLQIVDMEIKDEKIWIASDSGIAVADISIDIVPYNMFLETSSYRARLNAEGSMFYDRRAVARDENRSFTYPKDDPTNLIFFAGLWLANDEPNNQKLSVQFFSRNDFGGGKLTSNVNPASPFFVSVSKAAINFHLLNYNQPNYQMPKEIRDWPGNGRADFGESPDQAPYVDANNNGCYDPENGDYPYIIGDNAVFLIMNDEQPTNEYSPDELGVEIHLLAYTFDLPNVKHIDRSLFFRYTIINRSQNDYNNIKFGLYKDMDIGWAVDDAVGTVPSSNIVYAYNKDDFDEISVPAQPGLRGYGSTIPAMGFKSINIPLEGSIAYRATNPQAGPVTPFTIPQFYRGLDLLWNDSLPITPFANGYNPSRTDAVKFSYPGDLKKPNEWSAIHPGVGADSLSGSDAISLSVVKPFALKSGEKKSMDFVYSIGVDSSNTNYLDNVELMIDNANLAARFQQGVVSILPDFSYSSCITSVKELTSKTTKPQLAIFPNPSQGHINVISNDNIESARVIDIQGRLIQTYNFDQIQRMQTLELPTHLSNGFYIIETTDGSSLKTEKFLLNR